MIGKSLEPKHAGTASARWPESVFLHGDLVTSWLHPRLEEFAPGLPSITQDIQNVWNSVLQIEEVCTLLWETLVMRCGR